MPIYMEYEGIKGEVTKRGYEGYFEVVSANWRALHPVESKPAAEPLEVQLQSIQGATKLFSDCMNGKFARVRLSITRAGEQEVEYMRYDLQDVLITSYSTSHSSDDTAPTVTLTLNFFRVLYTIWFENAKAGRSSQSDSWDFSRSTV